MGEPRIGTEEWWRCCESLGSRGIVDCILRLLEQEEISRAKAIELVAYLIEVETTRQHADGLPYRLHAPPTAPWEKLNFYERSSDGVL